MTVSTGLKELVLTVMDFDSLTANDFIGKISIPLQSTWDSKDGRTRVLKDDFGADVVGKAGVATITYRLEFRPMPFGSRIVGLWMVTLIEANNLIGLDGYVTSSTSD